MNAQKAEEVKNYLVNSIKNTQTKGQVENMLEGKLDDIREIHKKYGPASEYLLAAYDVEHLERGFVA